MLLKLGTEVLRKLLDNKVGGQSFATYITADRIKRNRLQLLVSRNIINANQAMLLPPGNMTTSSADFDISMLVCLLRNLCDLSHPGDQVWINPAPADRGVEANIARLRLKRNYVRFYCYQVYLTIIEWFAPLAMFLLDIFLTIIFL